MPSAPPEKGERKIVLTFDDGPSKVTSEALLDVLKKHEVRAMFCYVGQNAEKHPEILTRALNEGHQLGHHTMSHSARALSSSKVLRAEIEEYEKLVQGLPTRARPEMTYFRPPVGVITGPVRRVVKEKGLKYAYVTSYIHDAAVEKEGAEKLIKELKEKIRKRGGGVIVLHEMRFFQGDGYDIDKSWLPAAVDEFITWGKAEGYEFCLYDDLKERR